MALPTLGTALHCEGNRTARAMSEAWQAERAKLFVRSAELQARSRLLASADRSFSQAEHDEFRDELRAHLLALTEFRARGVALGRWRAGGDTVGSNSLATPDRPHSPAANDEQRPASPPPA